jgi:sugar lactone lactonase YvrE
MFNKLTTAFLCGLIYLSTPLFSKAQWQNNQDASHVIGAGNFTTTGTLTSAYAYGENPVNGKIFIAAGSMVYRYPSSAKSTNGEAYEAALSGAGLALAIGQIYDLAVDHHDNLWIVDYANHRILRYANASTINDLRSPNLVLGQANLTNGSPGSTMGKFSGPLGIVIKGDFLYVSEFINHRVLRFDNIYDTDNFKDGATASASLGTVGVAGTSASAFNNPYKLFVDKDDHLWVADTENNRVLKFNQASTMSSGASATLVLGQENFTNNATATTASGLHDPIAVALDALGNVYVADYANNRVLIYHSPTTNGAAANVVLGQADFTTKAPGSPSTNSFIQPYGLYLTTNDLAVVSYGHNRVMLFEPSTTLPVQLSNFTANVLANGHINFNWETSNETNNDYFEIHLSQDGKQFELAASIPSKHATGNAALNTKYAYAFNPNDMLLASFGLLSLLLLPAFKRRSTQMAIICVVVLALASCTKDQELAKSTYKYAKLMQVDKNGESKELKVIVIK